MLKGWRSAWMGLGIASMLAPCPPGWAASTPDRAADERAIVDGERAWGQAYDTGNVAAVERLLADGFRGVDPSGTIYDKASVIREVRDGPHGTSDEVGPVDVRFYGDTAIAQAREHTVGPPPERKPSETAFTDTWVRTLGRWQIVAAEDLKLSTVVPSPASDGFVEEKKALLALRETNNRAIAAHDLEGAAALDGDDFVFTEGSDGTERSAAEDRKAWAAEFAHPGFDRYVRTPTEVEVGERGGVLRAAESGTWEGIDRKPAGEALTFGRYFVHWTKASGRWREVSESYVTLGCRGPGC